ncbi:magnesium-translocating P-type ATPase [Eubacteriales bacterium OttesenSCG-928-A19]|nr:magnesium-translocating P-type ATPase [Eubacteriales bacterium OttesenSCG-928-A19]
MLKKVNGNTQRIRESAAKTGASEATTRLLRQMATVDTQTMYDALRSGPGGHDDAAVAFMRDKYGDNRVSHGKRKSAILRFLESFADPFTIILLLLAAVSFVTDVVMVAQGQREWFTVIIILVMVLFSGLLRFIQETRSGDAAERLSQMIRTTTNVERNGVRAEIDLEDVVVGDIVYLAAGDMIPADMRVLTAKDLFISQSALTGESEPLEKFLEPPTDTPDSVTEYPNLLFMGSTVVSGSATGIVIRIGDSTLFGQVAGALSEDRPKTSFEKGVSSVSWILIRFMLVMVPIVFFVNGFTKGDWIQALLFAISVAVGLTPEMLPMIVTAGLARGAVAMSKEKVIVKNLNAIQNFGAMDILCTDKTGTLTQDRVVLEYSMDVLGHEDARVLRHAFLNSYYQTGLKNLMDVAIINHASDAGFEDLTRKYEKVDEIPFDFSRRRMSVVVRDDTGKTQMITKGAVEEMLAVSNWAEYMGQIVPLTDEVRMNILRTADRLNDEGMRVLGLAQKTNPPPEAQFSVADETDMVMIGYLAFLDPPKETTAAAIAALQEHGVAVKILTGDNDRVTRSICKQVGLDVEHLLLGADVERMTEAELSEAVETTTVFAKLSPDQKATIVELLRRRGHTVGYMGDGINDAAAMKASDVGISVDTAVDVAKESADIILLQKDLMVLEAGLIEGRKTYANMIKYIKMTASSNFGNMFSVLAASAFLPFLPMQAIHLLLLNLIYDVACTAIPWDNVDAEYLKMPRQWKADSVGKFMVWFGPTSSVFDITTYLLLYFVICPAVAGGHFHTLADPAAQALFIGVFQAGWFVESMWTQTLVIHMIRTPKIPFLQSRASLPVTLLTFAGALVATILPFTPLGYALEFRALPLAFWPWLAATVLAYMVLVTVVKKIFVRRYGELL